MTKSVIKILVDHSGSMGSMQQSATEAIAGFIKERKAQGDNPKISLSEFDDTYSLVYAFTDIESVTAYTLIPRGSTALNDSIAKAVKELDEYKPGKERDKYLVIMTDGLENASVEHTKESVKALLEDRQAKGLKVIYLGSNQDAVSVAKSYSIPENSAITYRGSSGLQSAISGTVFLSSSPVSYSTGYSHKQRLEAMSDD